MVGQAFGDPQSALVALGVRFVFRGPDGFQFDNAPDSAKITGKEPVAGVPIPERTHPVVDVDMTEKGAKARADADGKAKARRRSGSSLLRRASRFGIQIVANPRIKSTIAILSARSTP
ncbi:hypothetical protein [Sinomonas albida]|uniref:hypothetical protein n=1 Tax=Sinomonas albida TaxID=369942 RepID=UPI0010A8A791|nr:hypothetical protein [Sinomonas albida]